MSLQVARISRKVTLEVRVLILVGVPSTQKDEPVPQSITVTNQGYLESLVSPRWRKISGELPTLPVRKTCTRDPPRTVKNGEVQSSLLIFLTGYWVHEDPVDIGYMVEDQTDGPGPRKLEFDLRIELLDQPVASGIAEVYLSRRVSTRKLIR